jgi:hypothetical protein
LNSSGIGEMFPAIQTFFPGSRSVPKQKPIVILLYNVLLADLATASSLLPWRTEVATADERITQGAARALRARIALYRGGYSLAKKQADGKRQ